MTARLRAAALAVAAVFFLAAAVAEVHGLPHLRLGLWIGSLLSGGPAVAYWLVHGLPATGRPPPGSPAPLALSGHHTAGIDQQGIMAERPASTEAEK